MTTNTDPVKVEADLNAMLPSREWGALSLRMILHGRRVCIARRPKLRGVRAGRFLPVVPGAHHVPTGPRHPPARLNGQRTPTIATVCDKNQRKVAADEAQQNQRLYLSS